MKYSTKTRIKSAALAVMMLLTSVPVSALTSVKAEAVTTIVQPEIWFYDPVTKNTSKGYELITGGKVTILESKNDGSFADTIALHTTQTNVDITSNSSTNSGTGGGSSSTTGSSHDSIKIGTTDSQTGLREIVFMDDFDVQSGGTTAGAKNDYATDTVSIAAIYKTLRNDGDVREVSSDYNPSNNTGSSTLRTITSTNVALDVVQESKITLKCTTPETDNGGAAFRISEDGTGTFEKITAVDYGEDSTKSGSFARGSAPNKKLVFILTGDNGLRYVLELNPGLVYENMIDDPETGTPIPDGTFNNYITVGTEFQITYSPIRSEAIMMTIMTPAFAIADLEDKIRSSNGETDQSYVELASGDSLTYITQNFRLRQRSDLHNGDFRIKWKWEPDENLTNGTSNDKVISIGDGDNSSWQTVGVNRKEDDVTGKLTAQVTYYDNEGTAMESEVILTKDVTVRGYGTPVNLWRENKTTGSRADGDAKVDYTEDDADERKRDRIVHMDAYEGGIESYNQEPKGPYEYTLELFMGAKNGTATYAEVVAIGGDPSAVTLQLDNGSGGFVDYNIGDRIDNPMATSADKSTPHSAHLKVKAAKQPPDSNQKTLTIQVNYYLPDNTGTRDVLYSGSSEFIVTFEVEDNTPSQDSSLKSFKIADAATGAEIPFAFDPETFRYTGNDGMVHIPFSTRGVTLTPELNDQRGSDNPMSFIIKKTSNNELETRMYDGEKVDSGADLSEDNGYRLNHRRASGEIRFYNPDSNPDFSEDMESGYVETVYTIEITVPCQDPRPEFWSTYTIQVIRDAPSNDSTLASLGVFLQDDDPNDPANNLIGQYGPAFTPDNPVYEIWVPYSTQQLRVRSQKSDSRAVMDELRVLSGDQNSEDIIMDGDDYYTLTGITAYDQNKEWLKEVKRHFDKGLTGDSGGMMTLRFRVTSEYGSITGEGGVQDYFVIIHRMDPSTDSLLQSLIITDGDENERNYTPAFRPDTGVYTLNIPYTVRQLKFNLQTNDPNVYKIELWEGELGGKGKKLAKYVNGTDYEDPNNNDAELPTLTLGVLSRAFDVQDVTSTFAQQHDGYHPFYIKIWAENSDERYVTQYLIRAVREEPSHDAALTDLLLKDGQNQNIGTFTFYWDQHGCSDPVKGVERGESYHVTVPYSTRQVTFTPTTSHEYATVEIRETGLIGNVVGSFFPYMVESGATSKPFNLAERAEVEKEFHVIVTAEDGKTQWVYCIMISREPPSDDARLKSLTTQNTSKLKPQFLSSTLEYTADVNEGAPGVILTPTANHPGATIRVDGVVVQSGSPTDLIELLEITQTVRIEVIAEDGVTRMVYRVTFTNQNLIEKTSNADLRNLTVNYGLMTPNFQAAVLDYEVTTKENAWSVDIIPKLADPYATMRVLNGTLELGDYNGNYAMAIADGLNEVSVEVTSPDKTVTKTYSVDIYRNDEEKLKNWTPLEAEDINFEQVGNPIIVKIDEYPRVGASVFNTIREEYPDRSIIFQGNDYSIRFDGENLTRVIPQTEIYDFQMSLTSPDEDAIYDLIAAYDYNDDIISDIVMLYFDYHGALPGPAAFSLSLGRHYANDLLYWHYYNKERDRIDYYGTLQSNSKGNIAVSIDHFSTYIVSPEHRIAGSEDKDGIVDELGMVSNGDDLLGSGGKLNPDTGAASGEADQPRALPDFGHKPDLYTRKKEDP